MVGCFSLGYFKEIVYGGGYLGGFVGSEGSCTGERY